MSSNGVRKESPLIEFNAAERSALAERGVRLREKPFLGHVNVRGDTGDNAFLNAVKTAAGIDLPLEANTYSTGGDVTALWLGPNEWLLICPVDGGSSIADALRKSLGDTFASVTEISGGQTVINIAGEHARDVLAKGCSLDLHPRVFGPGRCAQSLVAKAGVTLRQNDVSPSFDLIVRRSFADYLAQWLEDAAAEYGLEVATAE